MDAYKLVIINSEGTIDRRGDRSDEDLLHISCLIEFIKEKYPNNKTLNQLTMRHTANTGGFFFSFYGNIVVFNTTKHEEKYGKSIFTMMPSSISEEQKKSLEELLAGMPTYSMTIAYDLQVVEGILEGKEFSSTEKVPPMNILEKYYQKAGIPKAKGESTI